jgi:dethiobiotin synthetase
VSPRRGLFVAGTDTEIGKTLVSCTLVRLGQALGVRTAGFKPISAGRAVGGVNEDVTALHHATGLAEIGPLTVGPIQLLAPSAPSVAADQEHLSLSLEPIWPALKQLEQSVDCVIVEGVGGFDVPLSHDCSTADLARLLGLPVVLVVGMRLGCMNHALLTLRAIQSEGLLIAGWIANTVDPDMLFSEQTFFALRDVIEHRFGAPCLGRIPRLDQDRYDPLDALHTDGLRRYFVPT